MKMKKEKIIELKLLALASAIILLAVSASALGITPARTIINFEPGLEKNISHLIINSEHKTIGIEIFTRGDLARYMTTSENSFTLEPEDDGREIDYKLNLPETLEPGKHMAEIVIVGNEKEAVGGGNAYVGGRVALVGQAIVDVPYPGKYLDSNLLISENSRNFYIPLINKGNEKIEKIYAEIKVYDLAENEVASLKTNNISLNPEEKKEIGAEWGADAAPGEYIVKATVYYDGEYNIINKKFNIKEKFLELKEIAVEGFKLGEINKMDIDVKNWWNEPILDAYAELEVYKDGVKVGDSKSSSYNILPGREETMPMFWDTANIAEGEYDSKILLKYNNRINEETLKMRVSDNEIEFIGSGRVISVQKGKGNYKWIGIVLGILAFLVVLVTVWTAVVKKSRNLEKIHRR